MPTDALRVTPSQAVDTPSGFRISCAVEGQPDGIPDELWFDVASSSAPVRPPDTAAFAACAMLPAAMAAGRPLQVDGPLRAGLVRNLLEYVDAWSMWRPERFARVEIHGDLLEAGGRSDERGTVLAYSGGLDSSYALVGHASGMFGARSFPPSLAVMIHGFDVPLDDESFAAAAAGARRQVEHFEIPLAIVRTNWRAFCIEWQDTHAAGLHAVLQLFDAVASRGVLASDYPYAHLGRIVWGSNVVTNPLLSDPSFPIISSGHGAERIEKAGAVARHPAISQHLRVCWEGEHLDRNCGRCMKCVVTQLSFLAAGAEVPPCLGEPDPDLVRALETQTHLQAQRLLRYAEGQDHFPPAIRDAFNEMMRREQARYHDPDAPRDHSQDLELARLERSLTECENRRAELAREIQTITESRRVRLATRLLSPVDRARARLRLQR